MEMQPPQQHFRINLAELKAQLVRKLGPDLSKQYFYYLNRFLSLKISKSEFNKICCRILGRDNIPLHNQFISSILKNACSAKHPPPSRPNEVGKAVTAFGSKESSGDKYLPNGSHSATVQASNSQGLSNGDMLPLSPRKARSGYRDRRSGDRRSALGLNGKTNFASQLLGEKEPSDFNAISENGISIPADVLAQHHQRLMPQSENQREAPAHPAAQLLEEKEAVDGSVSVCGSDQIEVSVKLDGKKLHASSQLQAPLGISFSSARVGLAQKEMAMPSRSRCISASSSGMLLDNVTLGERMEQVAASQGLEGVSADCPSILNNGLDTYLKGLISSFVELAAARSEHEPIKNKKHLVNSKLVNGIRPGHLYQIQNSSQPLVATAERRSDSQVSLQDFRVAMELNPQKLGVGWPLMLEKICSRSYEE